MNQRRAFILVNLSLFGLIGYLAHYLTDTRYVVNPEIEKVVEEVLAATPTPSPHTADRLIDTDWAHLRQTKFMNVLIELTPTPTPPPKATPKPFTLEEFIYPWKITALTSGSVEIHDAKEAKTFTMRLEGEGQVVLLQQQTMTVTLCGIDVNDLSATFCGDGQRHTIKY